MEATGKSFVRYLRHRHIPDFGSTSPAGDPQEASPSHHPFYAWSHPHMVGVWLGISRKPSHMNLVGPEAKIPNTSICKLTSEAFTSQGYCNFLETCAQFERSPNLKTSAFCDNNFDPLILCWWTKNFQTWQWLEGWTYLSRLFHTELSRTSAENGDWFKDYLLVKTWCLCWTFLDIFGRTKNEFNLNQYQPNQHGNHGWAIAWNCWHGNHRDPPFTPRMISL